MLGPGIDPRKMQKMMKQMGIDSKDIDADKVVIETEGGSYVIQNPKVVQITMQGQKSFQISGDVKFEEEAKSDDIKLIMEQAGCSESEAKEALEKSSGDIASAILLLKGENQ